MRDNLGAQKAALPPPKKGSPRAACRRVGSRDRLSPKKRRLPLGRRLASCRASRKKSSRSARTSSARWRDVDRIFTGRTASPRSRPNATPEKRWGTTPAARDAPPMKPQGSDGTPLAHKRHDPNRPLLAPSREELGPKNGGSSEAFVVFRLTRHGHARERADAHTGQERATGSVSRSS